MSLRKTCLLSLQGAGYNPGILSLMLWKYTLICQCIWLYAGHLMDFLSSKGSYSFNIIQLILIICRFHIYRLAYYQNLFVTSKSILGHLCVYSWTCTQNSLDTYAPNWSQTRQSSEVFLLSCCKQAFFSKSI